MPSAVRERSWNCPIVAVARYGAIGSEASQCQVARLPRGVVPASTPLATASRPRGTVIRNENAALSSGWSLAGNQVEAPSGWPATSAPSSVWMKPESVPSERRPSVFGLPR